MKRGRSVVLVTCVACAAFALPAGIPAAARADSAAPTVDGLGGSGRTTSELRFNATIDPQGLPTRFYVEWGEDAGYGRRLPAEGEFDAGSGTAALRFSKLVAGLAPGREYHVRYVASNAAGTTVGADRTVRTLSEDSAYEMVSPVDKGGNSVTPGDLHVVQTTPSGDGAAYMSTGAFSGADASYPFSPYVSRRGADGWTTRGINPPQLNTSANALGNVRFLSGDLTRTVSFSRVALAPGAVAGAVNVYLQDVRDGSYRYLAHSTNQDLFVEVTNILSTPVRAGNADGSRIYVEVAVPLTPDAAPGVPNLYEVADGTIRLVGLLPDGSVPPSGSTTDSAFNIRPTPISDDGRRLVYSADGALYLHQDDGATIPISVSHRPSDPQTPVGAQRGGMSADGSIVVLVSDAALSPDAVADGRAKLYRYDVTHDAMTLITPAVVPTPVNAALRVLSVSRDGDTVAFGSGQAFTPEATPSSEVTNLYVWHRGGTLAWVGSATGDFGPLSLGGWALSPNGEHFVVGTDQVRLYDRATGAVTCISCGLDGSGFGARGQILQGSNGVMPYFSRAVLDDGTAFFDTAARLLPEDTDGKRDVYRFKDGQLDLVSAGTTTDSTFADASADGRSVFFLTGDRLVGQDRDDDVDLYVARAGGGIAAQNPAPPAAGCAGDACQGPLGTAPGIATAGSLDFAGAGNVPAAAPARRATLRVSAARTVRGAAVTLRVRASAAGTVVAFGASTRRATRRLAKAGMTTLRLVLTPRAQAALRRTGTVKSRVAVRLTPQRGTAVTARVVLTFRRPARPPAAKRAAAHGPAAASTPTSNGSAR